MSIVVKLGTKEHSAFLTTFGKIRAKKDNNGEASMDMYEIRSEDYGELQRVVDAIFRPGVSARATVSKLDVMMRAEPFDLCDDLAEVIDLLPSRTFTRVSLCDQINSILSGHGWGGVYGTVE